MPTLTTPRPLRMLSQVAQRAGARAVVTDWFASAGVTLGGAAPYDPTILDERFYARLLRDGPLGLGESYMEGWWECDQLDELIARILRGARRRPLPFIWRAAIARVGASLTSQSPRSSRRFIAAHYDLGNEFFEVMLGPSMAYSCAYWRAATTLDAAQLAKHRLICDKLALTPADTLLDIGCGWGGLAHHAASTIGCRVVGITLSAPQAEYARARCRGLPVQIERMDYRAPELARLGPFSKIASVGMFEHVGRRNYATFFQQAARLLEPSGLCLLHTVGRHASAATDPWVSRYIFPGGMLPRADELTRAVEGRFVIEDWHNFGADYDRTLLAWYDNCRELLATKEPRFRRMWRYYLLAFAGNFRTRYRNQLWQLVLSPHGAGGGYTSVR
ncbi:MAG: cyclopropane fatty acyl phospholipid synthase [Kofleriaceae bacterium]